MIHLTQLIYLKSGKEEIFDQFENVAIPAISKYNGRLLLRLRPTEKEVIESSMALPYEIHLVEFPSQSDFESFQQDEERRKHLHLKEESVRHAVLIKGTQL